MLTIVFDTNSIYKHPWLTTLSQGKEVLKLAEEGLCRVIIPQVVRDELHRQQTEAATSSYGEATQGISAMTKAGVDMKTVEEELRSIHADVIAGIGNAFDQLFLKEGVFCEPIPQITIETLLQRDLARRRPFEEIDHKRKQKSVGFRDALIWETVLAILKQSTEDDTVYFVTSDHGFLAEDKHSFHLDLLSDLQEINIDISRLRNVKNIFAALTVLKEQAAIAAQTSTATEALYELVGESLEYHVGPGGDYVYPDFVKFSLPGLEGARISDMEQVTEFVLSHEENIVVASAEWTVYIDGAMFKSDWYAIEGEEDSIHIGNEINRHYYDASTSVEVTAKVELDLSGGNLQVVDVELYDLPTPDIAETIEVIRIL